jgi:predicted acylesterase/phospholipase RssA
MEPSLTNEVIEEQAHKPITNLIFGPIALSLSGGGYRAAAFHLGTLSMLRDLGLLEDVKTISTVSGGSIVGGYYSCTLSDGLSFEEFRDRFYDFLRTTNVISSALLNLHTFEPDTDRTRMPSLIRAAARVYNGGSLLNGKLLKELDLNKGHLREVIVNTTEFQTGGSFRFVSSTSKDIRSGNNNYEIKSEVAREIRLCDAVAASSCFPSGFEPIRFPSDFEWSSSMDLASCKEKLGDNFSDDIPLMDGGIFDNQGIDSVRNVADRKGNDIGLYIISDTSARDSKSFDFPPEKSSGFIPIWIWRILFILMGIAAAFSAISIISEWRRASVLNDISWFQTAFTFVLPVMLALSVFALVLYSFFKSRTLMRSVREMTGIELWKYIRGLTLDEVVYLVKGRIDSVVELTSNVFMRRVRLMGFESVFADLDIRDKLVPNLIYDLDNESRWGSEIKAAGLAPKDRIRRVAAEGEKYETNLWFLDHGDLDNLILCGRATICFKLIKYMLRERATEISIKDSPESKLFVKASAIWNSINL